MITPDGDPFYSVGVNHVTANNNTDNELKWGKDWRNNNTMLDEYMMLEEGSPGREVAMEYESDPPNTYPPIYLTFDTQVERAAAYDEYVQNCFDAPYIVGQHWFEYVDQPVGGRGDGEDNNFGLVTVDDVPYGDFVSPVTVTNARAPHVTE